MYQGSKNMKTVQIMQYEDSGNQSGHEHNAAGLPCQPANSLVEGMSSAVNIQELPSYESRHKVHSLQQDTVQLYSELICTFETYFFNVHLNIICVILCIGLLPWGMNCYSWVP
jgi:hypothetical protein